MTDNVIDITPLLEPGEKWVSIKTAAEHFEIGVRTVERLISAGEIPVLKIGRSTRVRISDILKACTVVPAVQ